MKHFLHLLTVSEQQQLEAFIAKDSRIKAIKNNYKKNGFLNIVEEIAFKQIVQELVAEFRGA